MSLNGDLVVMRNGRATSQISVYNYPEHLNPFYEDDQHKRLRFWKISSKKNDNEGRRNSFSLSGLKDVWAFKSFRLKKKSSTLGINKTSESPPPLRRDIAYDNSKGSGFLNVDQRSRYSVDSNHNNSGNFQRNGFYRGSLQNMQSAKNDNYSIGLNRNDQYRSTIQFAGRSTAGNQLTMPQTRRYVYSGSVTEQPQRKIDFVRGDLRDSQMRGSSQLSVASTNPFDTDDEDERKEVLMHSTPIKRTPRKKYKAPAPPVSILKLSDETQQEESNNLEESLISNLTAEIESFVKSSNESTEGEHLNVASNENISSAKIETPKRNGAIPKDNFTPVAAARKTTKVTATTTTAAAVVDSSEKSSRTSDENCKITEVAIKSEPTKQSQIGHMECIHVHVEKTQNIPEENEASRVTSFRMKARASPEKVTSKTSFVLTSPPTVAITETIESETVAKTKSTQNTENITATKSENENHYAVPQLRTSNLQQCAANELHIVEDLPSTKPTPIERESIKKPPIAAKPHIETKKQLLLDGKNRFENDKSLNTEQMQLNPISKETVVIKLENQVTTNHSHCDVQNDTTSIKTTKCENVLVEPKTLKIVETNDVLEPNSTKANIALENVNNSNNNNSNKCSSNKCSSNISNNRSNACRFLSMSEQFEPLEHIQRTPQQEWKQSTLAPLVTPVAPEKRKSVKDIIESINRSQRLLTAAAHKDLVYPAVINNADHGRKLNSDNDFSAQVVQTNNYTTTTTLSHGSNEQYNDLHQSTHNQVNNIASSSSLKNQETNNNVNQVKNKSNNEEDQQKLNNDEIIRKGRVNKEVFPYRESSPITSNLDWNPVPKPKRTKNLSDI